MDLLYYTMEVMIMDKDETICTCFGLTVGDIEEAYNNGAKTYEELQDATSCGTACGMCEDDIRGLIEKLSS